MVYGISATVWERNRSAHLMADVRCASAVSPINQVKKKGSAMELVVVFSLFALLALASMLGLTADSRDSADWKPSQGGRRATG